MREKHGTRARTVEVESVGIAQASQLGDSYYYNAAS